MKYLAKLLFLFLISIISFCLTHVQNDIGFAESSNYIQNDYQKVVLITQNSSMNEVTAVKKQTDSQNGLICFKTWQNSILSNFFKNNKTHINKPSTLFLTSIFEDEISIRAP